MKSGQSGNETKTDANCNGEKSIPVFMMRCGHRGVSVLQSTCTTLGLR